MRREPAIGIDGMNFEMRIAGQEINNPVKPLVRANGIKYGTVEMRSGVLRVMINPSKYVRDDNVLPFSNVDMDCLAEIKKIIYDELQNEMNQMCVNFDVKDMALKKIECGITKAVDSECTCSQVLNLIKHCKDKVVIYQGDTENGFPFMRNETVMFGRKNYYLCKSYDKSLEQRHNNPNVESNLLRVEMVFYEREIRKIFGERCTFENIFSEEGFFKVIDNYKKIFSKEIIDDIKVCLNRARTMIFEELTYSTRPIVAAAKLKEIVFDEKVFRLALRKWYRSRNLEDHSRQTMGRLNVCGFPKGVLKTIKQFHLCCKDK